MPQLKCLDKKILPSGSIIYSTKGKIQWYHRIIRAIHRATIPFLSLYILAVCIGNEYIYNFFTYSIHYLTPQLYHTTSHFLESCPDLLLADNIETFAPTTISTSLGQYKISWIASWICLIYLSFSTHIVPLMTKVPFYGILFFMTVAYVASSLYNHIVLQESLTISPDTIVVQSNMLNGTKSTQIIAREDVTQYAIHEGFSKCKVLFFFFLHVKDSAENIVPFQDQLPPFDDLLSVLKDIDAVCGLYSKYDKK